MNSLDLMRNNQSVNQSIRIVMTSRGGDEVFVVALNGVHDLSPLLRFSRHHSNRNDDFGEKKGLVLNHKMIV